MIHVSNISKHYGPKVLFKEGSFQINSGEKIGLVGPNGAGKTSLFRLIVGEELADEGRITKPERLAVGYFSQNIGDMSGRSALEEVKGANPQIPRIQERLKEIETLLSEEIDPDAMSKILEEYGDLQGEFERLGGYNIESQASEILTGLGIGPDLFHRPVETFSGGWKMRIALAKILLLNPDVLLMDEPTNHLDLESIIWLETWLTSFSGAIFMTCHDREFMNRVVRKIVEVANQRITVYSGNYDFYENDRKIREEKLLASAKRQDEMLAKEREFIARFAARASHAAQVQSRVKKLEKIDIIEIPTEERTMSFEWPNPPRGGDEVLKVEDLGKSWPNLDGTEKQVFRHANALVKRMDRVAVVGVNGAGKSTFMKIITGQTSQTEGRYVIGPSIEFGYFSQNSLDVLNPQNSIVGELEARLPNASLGYIRTLLGAFRFSGEEADKRISILSGGEKSRVVLATILAQPVNLLVLDEPTNHLDIKSREVLLEAIKRFPGTVMMVSHDRFFLRELTTRVFEIDQHELHVYNGSWDYYLEKKASLQSS
ncbi:MAG: ABC-F family ATP-binding cassette domain-containing protein [Bdellovibrionales bacterium]|nr:ABC-F family ATP-binding cassette domain-containing protein [Bdellovibrionales bacterium]